MGKRKYQANDPADIAEWLRLLDLPKGHPHRQTPVKFHHNYKQKITLHHFSGRFSPRKFLHIKYKNNKTMETKGT